MSKFVVHTHYAKKAGKHDDLRIELKPGKLTSWAVPKGIPRAYNKKVLAIQTQDHNMSWYNFQGTIDDGYGAGRIVIKDKGFAKVIKSNERVIIVELKGIKHKVYGKYILVNVDKNKHYWLLWRSRNYKNTKNKSRR